jgi:hypothetical protein
MIWRRQSEDWKVMCIAAALAGLAAALALGDGCGGEDAPETAAEGSERAVASPQPSGPPFYETRGTCSTGSFHVDFDARGRVKVRNGDELLASATFDRREVGGACTDQTTKIPITAESPTPYGDDELGSVNHESMSLDCESRSPVEISVHPIWDESGRTIGSSVLAAANLSGTPTLLVTAPMKPGGVHLYYAAKYCEVV